MDKAKKEKDRAEVYGNLPPSGKAAVRNAVSWTHQYTEQMRQDDADVKAERLRASQMADAKREDAKREGAEGAAKAMRLGNEASGRKEDAHGKDDESLRAQLSRIKAQP